MTHPIFKVKNGDRIIVGHATHTVTKCTLLKNRTGGTGRLLWTQRDTGSYFLIATHTNALEILGYTPAKKVAWGAEGFLYNGTSYELPKDSTGWFAEGEVDDIYNTVNRTGSGLLVIRCGTNLTAFTERTRYHPAIIR